MDARDDNDEIDVFISYATEDADHDVLHPHELEEWLKGEGYKVWWDLYMGIGDAQKQLGEKVKRAKYVIALYSPRADESRNVFYECQPAANDQKLLPIIVEGTENVLPPEWRHLKWLPVDKLEPNKDKIRRVLPPPSGKQERPTPPVQDPARVLIPTELSAYGLLIGRDVEKTLLATAWASIAPDATTQKTNIVVLHAIGGAGKTALMRHFLNDLADQGFAGADKVFGWSAYSQGSGDNRTANADAFIAEALAFFGHTGPVITDTVERGRQLAALVGGQRALMIIDGLEPLQELPHVNGGRLKDRGLAALITSLAVKNHGLLLITSRQAFPELEAHHNPRVICHPLDRLDQESGIKLLAALGVRGKRTEMVRAVNEVLGHALLLNLLGTYLSAVHGGDVNQREQFHLGEIEDADVDFIGDATARYAKRSARIMEGTVAQLAETETAILHMVGLFERPVEREALEALIAEPAISGLTEVFHGLSMSQRKARWNVVVERLRKLTLLNGEDRHQPGGLDAHPIVRAHFGDRLKAQAPETFRAAHSRLYDFYRHQGLPQAFRTPEAYGVLAYMASFPEGPLEERITEVIAGKVTPESAPTLPPSFFWADPDRLRAAATFTAKTFEDVSKQFQPDSLEGMRACFSAIAHGCAARRHREAYLEVYFPRVRRGYSSYIVTKLGALHADLAALAAFFDEIWREPAKELDEETQARIYSCVGYALRAQGRLREAIAPFDGAFNIHSAKSVWINATFNACNLSELHVKLGEITEAILVARSGITQADASSSSAVQAYGRTTLVDALHQAGQIQEARLRLAEAESLQVIAEASQQGELALPQALIAFVSALGCYRSRDFRLAQGQTAAVIGTTMRISGNEQNGYLNPLSVALDNLSLGRAHAILAIMVSQSSGQYATLARNYLDAAVEGLRRAGDEFYLPLGQLARAAFRRSQGDYIAAATDLAETYDIATCGDMRLHLTDWHLESARLALAQITLDSDATELRAAAEFHHAKAAKLIADTGYNRRLAELDAIRACLSGTIPAEILAPDRDAHGRPIWHHLATN
jgi:hypothetical protein